MSEQRREWDFNAREISSALDVTPRALRRLVRQGLFPGPRHLPDGAGGVREAWCDDDVERARAFRRLRDRGRPLVEVARELAARFDPRRDA